MEPASTGPPVAAAWYPDNAEPDMLRYWDGQRWTEHTASVRTKPVAVGPAPKLSNLTPSVQSDARSTSVANAAAGLAGRMLRRARANRSNTPPTVEEILAGCQLEPARHPLEEQVEVAGETYYAKGIKRVFAEQGLPISAQGSTLEMLQCVLVPNPWNPHDPNAIAVCVEGHQVGHMPADLCDDYSPHLIALARKEILVTGEARVWAKSDAGMVRCRVTILIPEAVQLR